MFQIDNASAATTQPASTPPGSAGFFTDGNPATSVPATIVPAEWLNSVMMELVNAVTGTGQTLNKAAFNQLLTAMQTLAKNPGASPPQFDNTSKTATTAWVNQRGMAFAGQVVLSAATTLTAALHAGREITITAAIAATLPLASTCPAGTIIHFVSNIAGVTVVRQGSDVITMGIAGGATSVALGQGDTLDVMSDGSSSWLGTGGSARLAGSALFTAQNSAFFNFSNVSVSIGFNQNTVTLASIPVTFPAASRTGKFRLIGFASSGGSWGPTTGSYIYSNYLIDPANGGANIGGVTNVGYFGAGLGFQQTTPIYSPYLYNPGAQVTFTHQANSNLSGTVLNYMVRLIAMEA